ncbi:hypothetical protein ACIBCN_27050 [Nocardia sp. NPDC051052]|uniref:hypothetical protein n=1 Tax=Nocardia sp. NPDC051052 TaxID=3364322 RepID=UPI003794E908
MNAASRDLSDGSVLLVSEVVRDVIAEVAPDELPLVDRLRPLGDEHAVRLLSRRKRGRDLLGFGIDDVMILASPVVWVVVNEAATRFTNSAISGGGKGLRRLVRRPRAVSVVPALTRDQIAEIHTQIMDSAVRSGMDNDRARVVADSVAGRLALGGATDAEVRRAET